MLNGSISIEPLFQISVNERNESKELNDSVVQQQPILPTLVANRQELGEGEDQDSDETSSTATQCPQDDEDAFFDILGDESPPPAYAEKFHQRTLFIELIKKCADIIRSAMDEAQQRNKLLHLALGETHKLKPMVVIEWLFAILVYRMGIKQLFLECPDTVSISRLKQAAYFGKRVWSASPEQALQYSKVFEKIVTQKRYTYFVKEFNDTDPNNTMIDEIYLHTLPLVLSDMRINGFDVDNYEKRVKSIHELYEVREDKMRTVLKATRVPVLTINGSNHLYSFVENEKHYTPYHSVPICLETKLPFDKDFIEQHDWEPGFIQDINLIKGLLSQPDGKAILAKNRAYIKENKIKIFDLAEYEKTLLYFATDQYGRLNLFSFFANVEAFIHFANDILLSKSSFPSVPAIAALPMFFKSLIPAAKNQFKTDTAMSECSLGTTND